MGIRLDIKSELPTAIKWTNQHTKQLPFSIAQAINASVQGSKFIAGSKQKSALNRLAGSSRRYLDRPKKQTQKGFRATVAKKATLTSVIKTKDRPYNMGRYIDQNIFGGDRKQKYDALFVKHSTATNITGNSVLVPTKNAFLKRDRYGNITKSTINKIITAVGTKNVKGNNIFIGKPKGGNRPAGVYRRERGNKLSALFIAQPNASYPAIFPAKKEAEDAIQKTFGMYLRRQLQVNVANNLRRKL
tara:strand:- start:33 stop:767 length:735 start_codon:yes stop_codon:yes gene_type:complete